MKLKELSVQANVGIPTIKYYLREGLLPKGEPLGETKADYGPHHLERLRLIRTLVEVGEVPIARIKTFLEALDDDSLPASALLSVALSAATLRATPADEPGDRTGADDILAARSWTATPEARDQLAHALAALRRHGLPADATRLTPYLEAAGTVAAHQRALLPSPDDRSDFAVQAVVQSVLHQHLMTALVRLATENA